MSWVFFGLNERMTMEIKPNMWPILKFKKNNLFPRTEEFKLIILLCKITAEEVLFELNGHTIGLRSDSQLVRATSHLHIGMRSQKVAWKNNTFFHRLSK